MNIIEAQSPSLSFTEHHISSPVLPSRPPNHAEYVPAIFSASDPFSIVGTRKELGCRILVGDEVTTTEHDPIALTTFWCELVAGDPTPTEHAELRWVVPADLDRLTWLPADRPAVELVRTSSHPS